ncbi:MAG TPA: aromatic acid decarboxylase [Phycisphaerales bacterium]|nr:aromatic acid decarboxylase [Phycisphaerales bacterium]HCD31592.1 aromatic acid decarboxylase [Phycisphaerales bacterium]|tara:strand:+ start:206 stop:805 length:600 start_codon:yes stop_codon:yes gene_type:complete
MAQPNRIIVGISGASGALYAQQLVRCLLQAEVHVHLVVSPLGQRLLHDELGYESLDLQQLAGDQDVSGITLHQYRDVGASIASGSFQTRGMVICPCSSNSLSAVATGASNNLLHRAAQVTLKERRRLILLHREMPLSLVDIRNMQAATEAGAIIAPANPGFYLMPQSIDDIVDFVVARLLDLLAVDHQLGQRWKDQTTS